MVRNEITANELEGFVAEKVLEHLLGEFSQAYHRYINYRVGTAEYVVVDHGHEVYQGTNSRAALDAYYDIPRR
jgi:hypothetical protein